MADWKRVRWIGLEPARESTIAAHRFDPEKHEEVDNPAVDKYGEPLPAKFHTTVDEAAAARVARRRTSSPASSATTAEAPAGDGQQATDPEETS